MTKNTPGISWNTASPEAKKGFSSPPVREDFNDDESYEEAKSGFARVMRIVALRQSALNRNPKP